MIILQLLAQDGGLLTMRQAADENELNKFRKLLKEMVYRWEQNYPCIGRLSIVETGKLHDWVKVS